jgi:hypothetical protein
MTKLYHKRMCELNRNTSHLEEHSMCEKSKKNSHKKRSHAWDLLIYKLDLNKVVIDFSYVGFL